MPHTDRAGKARFSLTLYFLELFESLHKSLHTMHLAEIALGKGSLSTRGARSDRELLSQNTFGCPALSGWPG